MEPIKSKDLLYLPIFNPFSLFELKSIKCVFLTSVFLFITLFMIIIFYTNYFIISQLYNQININYVRRYLTEPISNLYENTTLAIDIRLKVIEQVMIESKMKNLELLTEFSFTNKMEFDKTYKSSYDYDFRLQNNSYAKAIKRNLGNLKFILDYTNKNYFINIKPEEIIIFNDNVNSSIALYNNWERNRPFLTEYINNNKEYIKKYSNNNFLDIIIENPYSIEDTYNYVKIFTVKMKIGKEEFTVLFGLRFDYKSTELILDKNKNNITFLFHDNSSNNINDLYFFLPVSNYFQNFFIYGLNVFSNSTSDFVKKYDDLPSSRREAEMKNVTFNIKNMFDLLNVDNTTNPTYNINLKDDFMTFGSLFNTILNVYFEHDYFKNIKNIIQDKKDYLNMYNLDRCTKGEYKYVNLTKVLCKILYFNENNTIPINNPYDNMTIKDDFDKVTKSIIDKKLKNVRYFTTIAFKSSDPDMSNFNDKKLIMFRGNINNLNYVQLQMFNLEPYSKIQYKFSNKIYDYFSNLFYVMICACVIIFFVKILITLYSMSELITRIKAIDELKHLIIYKNLDDIDNYPLKSQTVSELVKKCYSNELTRAEKDKYSTDDKFYEQIIIIVCETKMKINNFINNIENENDNDYLKKINLYKRTYRLLSNYNLSNSVDYIKAIEIFQELKDLENLSIISLKDICYNFNYTNQFINNNFKVFYRIIDLVEDNNGADKNNKYLNFEEIVKIICHVKRKLISPLLVNKN